MTRTLALALAATLLAGCPTDDTDPTDTDTDADTDTEAPRLVSVTGSTSELLTQVAAPEGLCAIAVEPTEALGGGDLTVLGQSTVDASGNFTIEDVDLDDATLAIFVVLQDCDQTNTISFPTGTGIAADDYRDTQAGETLTRDSIWIAAASATGVNASLAAAGSTKTLDDGMIMALVANADGSPAIGATVSCDGDGGICDNLEAYYVDADPTDGLFGTAGVVNDSTVTGLAAIAAGPVATYTANADGKTFSSSLFGSIPGLVAFTQFTAE